MIELISIDNVNIPFDINWKKIAVSLSGGADSALLSYLLCEIIEKHNLKIEVHIISQTRMWKTRPWQSYDSERVYNFLTKRFNNINFWRHSGFVAPDLEWGSIGPTMIDEYGKKVSGDNIQIRSYSEYICFYEDIDAFYNGVTRNPKDVGFNGLPTRDIDPTIENKHLEFMEHMGKVVCHPFRFIDKSWVIKQYRNKCLMDLLDITRSCEGEFNGIDYISYKKGMSVPVCGDCFWCKEREWAIEKSK